MSTSVIPISRRHGNAAILIISRVPMTVVLAATAVLAASPPSGATAANVLVTTAAHVGPGLLGFDAIPTFGSDGKCAPGADTCETPPVGLVHSPFDVPSGASPSVPGRLPPDEQGSAGQQPG